MTTKRVSDLRPGDVFRELGCLVWRECHCIRATRNLRNLRLVTASAFGHDPNTAREFVMDPDDLVEVAE